MPIALYALALGGFGIGLTEFGTIGLLPQIGSDFSISAATAGYLVSGYALSVAIGGVFITIAVTKMEKKSTARTHFSIYCRQFPIWNRTIIFRDDGG